MRTIRLLSLSLAALPLLAQHAEINGIVTDATGAMMGGASVTITNTATNTARNVETNATGAYTAPFLVPGVYNVQAEQPGFKTALRNGVEIQVGAVVRIDFTMEIGGVTERVEVSGAAALLATEGTALGTVVENRRIVELPLNGRNYLELIALSPNVTHEMPGPSTAAGRQGGERSRQNFSIAGQRMEFNHYTLDGIENTDPNWNTFVFRPSVDALQEFKVETGIYSAEYGRNPGQVNVTTKSGTNNFHGTVFEFLRNDLLDAREWRQVSARKNPFRRNQYGFTLGGPLVRDRIFFLSNFEGLRDRKTLQRVASVATDRMRAGDFGGQRAIFDHLTRVYTTNAAGQRLPVSATQYPGNSIPANRLNPISLKLLEFYPRQTVPGDNINRNYTRDDHRPIDADQFIQRIDFNQNARSFWFGRFGWGNEFVQNEATFEPQEGRVETKTYQAMLANTRTFSASVVNELRLGYTQFRNDVLSHFARIRNVSAEVGIVGINPVPDAWGTPSIGGGNGVSGFGESNDGPFVNRNHIFQLLDNLSVIRGSHSLKFGGELRRERINQAGNAFVRGSIAFADAIATFNPANRAATGHAFADYMLGLPSNFEYGGELASAMLRATPWALYAEDVWKITPKITLNAGLRYELTPPYQDKYRGIMSAYIYDPGVGPNGKLPNSRQPALIRPGNGDFYEDAAAHYIDSIELITGENLARLGIPDALILADRNDFAPRVGIAYSPTNRWTLRAGAGIFYTHDQVHFVFEGGRNLAGRVATYASDVAPDITIGDPTAKERASSLCSNWTGPCQGTGTLVFAVDPRIRTGYVSQWTANIQRQLAGNLVVEVDYLGNQSHKLVRARQRNQALTRTGPNDATTFDSRRPWPNFPGRLQNMEGDINGNYHALSSKVTQRFTGGLTYMVGFTWAKSIDSGSGVRPGGGEIFDPRSSYDGQRERGLSQFDQRRRLVASFVYDLPFGRGPGALNRVIGGWKVSSILTFSDGSPRNVGNIGDINNRGEIPNFPDATGISSKLDNPSAGRFWNIGAFNATNPELTWRLGNVGRNTLQNPGLRQWDFSLGKVTRITEGHALDFRMEAFNFANHPNWNAGAVDVRVPATFGVINTARTMREIQLGLKYIF